MPRTRLNSSRLVRVLAELAIADGPAPKQSFAERLGQWLDLKDALALFSALNAGAAQAAGGSAASPASAAERKAYARVHASLSAAIAADPLLDPTAAAEPDFAPYQRGHLAHQRAMIAALAPLRASVRATVARRSSALARLAALDASFEQALATRERSLLATLPALLAARFTQLAASATSAAEAAPMAAGEEAAGEDWLTRFRGDMQAVLLAELELRLQPVAGLIAALDNEATS